MTNEEFNLVVITVAHTIRRAMDKSDFPGLNLSSFRRNRILDDDIIRKIQAHMILNYCIKSDHTKSRMKFLEGEINRLRLKILELNHQNYKLSEVA